MHTMPRSRGGWHASPRKRPGTSELLGARGGSRHGRACHADFGVGNGCMACWHCSRAVCVQSWLCAEQSGWCPAVPHCRLWDEEQRRKEEQQREQQLEQSGGEEDMEQDSE